MATASVLQVKMPGPTNAHPQIGVGSGARNTWPSSNRAAALNLKRQPQGGGSRRPQPRSEINPAPTTTISTSPTASMPRTVPFRSVARHSQTAGERTAEGAVRTVRRAKESASWLAESIARAVRAEGWGRRRAPAPPRASVRRVRRSRSLRTECSCMPSRTPRRCRESR